MDYDIIDYNGEEFVAMKWNGERYLECYKRADYCTKKEHTFPAKGWENKNISLRPVYKKVGEDEFELIGYEETY